MKRLFALLLACLLLLTGCQTVPQDTGCKHTDTDDNGLCDACEVTVLEVFDIYTINDLHGKVLDSADQPGVDELSTYIENARQKGNNVILLSTGDMWQGSWESNLTQGKLMTEWMNAMDFDAMVLGNHEFDWGLEPIQENAELADFPMLAINVYDRATDQRLDYCSPSVLISAGDVQIGIIGAVGDCYSSISADQVQDIYFKTGDALTSLVKKESEALREQGADFIIYTIHDGFTQSKNASVTSVTGKQLDYYYDISLSDGYVDLCFEAHTHQRYLLRDEHGVYHLQNKGDNKGISYVQVRINTANDNIAVTPELLTTGTYATLDDHPIVQQLMDKYADAVSVGSTVLGQNARKRDSWELCQLSADKYLEAGIAKWGQQYDIVLGGGFFSVRSPYYLAAGQVTYGDLQTLLPFDNELVLCSIKGRDLIDRFIETDNDRYYLCYSDYGERIKTQIDPNGTYYIIVDSYTSVYRPNNLTEIERYGEKLYARDLVAQYIKDGGYAK